MAETRFEGRSPVGRYWLSKCEGFAVTGGERGVVEELIRDADPFVTTRLVVRTGDGAAPCAGRGSCASIRPSASCSSRAPTEATHARCDDPCSRGAVWRRERRGSHARREMRRERAGVETQGGRRCASQRSPPRPPGSTRRGSPPEQHARCARTAAGCWTTRACSRSTKRTHRGSSPYVRRRSRRCRARRALVLALLAELRGHRAHDERDGRGQASVDRRVFGHARDELVDAALAAQHVRPELVGRLGERVVVQRRLEDPVVALELVSRAGPRPSRRSRRTRAGASSPARPPPARRAPGSRASRRAARPRRRGRRTRRARAPRSAAPGRRATPARRRRRAARAAGTSSDTGGGRRPVEHEPCGALARCAR